MYVYEMKAVQRKMERDSVSKLYEHKGFTKSWKLCLTLCSLR